MIQLIKSILVMLFLVSIFGYILVVLKEKMYLRNNLIIIDKKSVTQEHLDEVEIKEFRLGRVQVRAGDEVKIVTLGNKKHQGIILGAKRGDNSIVMVTHDDKVKQFNVTKIKKFKIISKYGKFFTKF